MRTYTIASLIGTAALSAVSAPQPNIVFIFSDDHATQAISSYGFEIGKLAPTPNIDRLAQDGMRFDRCMVGNSICGPSRATILTGKHSHMNGFRMNDSSEFDGSQTTFPKLLRQNGYETAIIGKWHLGSTPTGFDYWEVLPDQGIYYRPEFLTSSGKVTEEGYVTDVITDKAIDWLSNQRDSEKPFMLMVQHKAPHREWSPPVKYLHLFDEIEFPEPETLFDDYTGRSKAVRDQDMTIDVTLEADKDLKVNCRNKGNVFYQRVYSRLTDSQKAAWDEVIDRRVKEFSDPALKGKALVRWKYQQYIKDYLRCVRSVDDNVGRLLDFLKQNGLDQNTVVVYSSDQGFYLGEHGWFDKRFMYDESYRTPLLIQWPGTTPAGSSCKKLVSNLDFAETFLDVAGVSIPADMQGESLVPLLKGEAPENWRNALYYHYYEYPGWHMVQRHEGAYDGRYKLIHYYDIDEWELIDTEKDHQELRNEYSNPEYADVIKRMQGTLGTLKQQYSVPSGIPTPRDADPMYYYSTKRREMEQISNSIISK